MTSILSKSAYSLRLLKLHDPYGIPLSRVFGQDINEATYFLLISLLAASR